MKIELGAHDVHAFFDPKVEQSMMLHQERFHTHRGTLYYAEMHNMIDLHTPQILTTPNAHMM